MNLQDYRNDLFATRSTMLDALNYVNTLCSAASTPSDSAAMRTAVHTVLNTAIELHKTELQVLVEQHNELSAKQNPVTALLALVDERVQVAMADKIRNFLRVTSDVINERVNAALDERMDSVFADKFDAAVDSWADDNLSSKMDDWYGDNVDITDDVKKVVEDEIDLDDLVQEKVTAFFGSNTFSIEPR